MLWDDDEATEATKLTATYPTQFEIISNNGGRTQLTNPKPHSDPNMDNWCIALFLI